MAHIGVLETLEQQRVPVDAIVGTSMGAIVGGLYASGVSPEEMRRSLLRIDWEDTFNDAPSRKLLPIRRKEEDLLPLFELEAGFNRHGFGFPSGLVAGQKLNFILQTMFLRSVNCTSFDDLPIPFRAIATDLETGEMVVLDHGDLPTAIRASMAFPVLFTPVKYDDRLLVDGGVVRNLAVDVALDMGAERIIAVDVGSTLGDLKSGTPTAFGVLRRTQSVMAQATRAEQLADLRDQDILIVPQLDGLVSFSDFDRVDAAIDRGVSAAEGQARRLETFAVPRAEDDADRKRQWAGSGLDPIRVESIEIRGAHRVDPRRIRDRIRTRVGGTLDVKTLREDLQRVYLIGEFELVEFHLEPSTEGKRFVVDVEEKSWGPWYVRGGIGLATNFSGDSAFVVLGLLRRTELNRLGAEWRSLVSIGEVDGFETDLYQPVTYKGTVFVNPRLYTIRTKNERATFGDVEFAIDSRASAIELDVGTLLSNWGEFRLGVFAGRTTNAPLEPIPGDPDLGRDLGGFVVGARYDRLDNSHFPAHGQLGVLAGRFSRPGVGADDEYDRVELRLAQAESFGRNTLLGRLALGTDLGSDLPFYDDFELGGFQNLSGLDRDALRGSRLALAALTFYRQVRRKPGLFGARYYVGASLEAGNAWASGEDATLGSLIGAGSVFVGADTLLGPLYLGYGHTDDGRESLYLFLGRLF